MRENVQLADPQIRSGTKHNDNTMCLFDGRPIRLRLCAFVRTHEFQAQIHKARA